MQTNIDKFISILHRGGKERFTQNLTAGPKGEKKTVTLWSRTDEPLRIPANTGFENIYYSVNPLTMRVTDRDRAKYPGKSDKFIEQRVASKNTTVAALNCLYADLDGKDFTEPDQAAIQANYQALRADPANAEKTDKALSNEAKGKAKSDVYKLDPAKYLALAIDHIGKLNPQPSVIVFSGGGFQCFWLFSEPFVLTSDEDRQRAISVQRRWVAFVGGDKGVCDIRRVLRLPGSINHKKAYAPNYPLVTFEKADFDLRYTLDELEALLPAPAPGEAPQERQPQELTPTQQQVKDDSFISLFNSLVNVRDLLLSYGYTDGGERLSRPGEPESKGVVIDPLTNRSQHWSYSDDLYSVYWQTPFNIWKTLEFDGDFMLARQALIDLIIPDLRLWARTTSFEEFCTETADGVYRTDATDTKVCDAMLDIYEKVGGFGASVSKRIGGREAGLGADTFLRSLYRMWDLFEVTYSITTHALYVRFRCENSRLQWLSQLLLAKGIGFLVGGSSTANEKNTPVAPNEYSPRKADEPFLTGTSREMRERYRLIAQTLEITVKQAKEQDEHTFPGLGEASLRVIDALLRVGADMTAQELADETGKKLSSIRTALQRLEQHSIVEAEREGSRGPKVYGLSDAVWQRIDAIAPTLRTYKLGSQRENKRLEQAQQWCNRGIDQAKEPEQAQALQVRFAKLAQQRVTHLTRLHPELSQAEIIKLAYEVAAYKRTPEQRADLRAKKQQAADVHRQEVKAIREAALQAAKTFFDAGLERPTRRMILSKVMRQCGFNTLQGTERQTKDREVNNVLSSPALMKPYWDMAHDPSRLWNSGARRYTFDLG